MSQDLADLEEVKRLFDLNNKLSKVTKINSLILIEWSKKVDELRENIKIEKSNHEIQAFELEKERDITLRLKKLKFKKPNELLKIKEYAKETHKIKDKIIENTNLEEDYIKACDNFKITVQNLTNDVNTFESSKTLQTSKYECQQIKEKIKEYIDKEKEKKDELMKLSIEYLHPSNWKENLIKLVTLRKKKLLQQTGIKIVKENNRLIEENTISEDRRQKIQQLTQKIFDDLRVFDKKFGIGDFISFLE
ncbi:Hypothetical protein SRAE_2000083500 [Strongyloides ratti]|uniref:Uncharacterized protein n=1 Tax=Strongyloides ratti TaxID=34506 RepID=A0A090LF92_STRRB|nr:Hypothetical protein SRAE_2000083500 [Strongyloides ratti]CEF66165.1 Hypothetical protein SRAE_2000083500 [Strongyloides ratti]